jgi:hypothetical protein
MEQNKQRTPSPTLAPAPQAPQEHTPAVSNRERADARGLGTMPYPAAGSSTKVQGIDGFDPEALAGAIVADTLDTIGEADADASALRAAVLGVINGSGRSGKLEIIVGSRKVSLDITTEIRNVRALKEGVGPVTAGDSEDASHTGTGTVGVEAGSEGGHVAASYSEANTQGAGRQRSIGIEADVELVRGDITTTWDIYHTPYSSAVVGVSPLMNALGAHYRAAANPAGFGFGTRSSGTLTAARLTDK